jgi:hypothetical protein
MLTANYANQESCNVQVMRYGEVHEIHAVAFTRNAVAALGRLLDRVHHRRHAHRSVAEITPSATRFDAEAPSGRGMSDPAGESVDMVTAPRVLREYALLADGERGALIGPTGDIAWMCAPGWADDAVFSALIGGPGSFAVTPKGRFVWGGYYEENSLIWRSRWVTSSGIVECREALAYPGVTHRVILLRRIIAVRGPACVDVTVRPATASGGASLRHVSRDHYGIWRAVIGDLQMHLLGASDAQVVEACGAAPALTCSVALDEGAHHDLVFHLSDRVDPDGVRAAMNADRLWEDTEACWTKAIPRLDASIAASDARHSYAVLRGLTSATGGMVAAATTSLPERAAAGRNYDYRYVWIRDQCYAGQAVAVDGPHPLLDDAVSYVSQRLLDDGPDLKPAYTVDGGSLPDQHRLDLPGYPGASVIIGNQARDQFQLDAFGEALLLFAAAARHDRLDSSSYRAVTAAAAAIEARWCQPDAGVWELDPQRWAHSRLVCAAGLRAIAAHGSRGDAARWSALAEAIVADAADCRHPSGRWQRAPKDTRVDAALLLSGIRGALPVSDPVTVATVRAVAEELSDDFFVYRFRHDARPLAEAEGAFTLCGFLMALAVHQQGDPVSAARYFERNRSACGPPGLYAEEYDVRQRQMRGNLPQAFVHALMLETSLTLAGPPTNAHSVHSQSPRSR